MLRAFANHGTVTHYFKDNSTVVFRFLRTFLALFTREVVFTRSYFLAVFARFFCIKCIYELHEIHPRRNYKWLGGASRLLVVCISEMLGLHLKRSIGGRSLSIVNIPDGCDVELIEKLKSDRARTERSSLIAADDSRKVLLHTGSSYKFRAERFEEILNELPSDWVFVHMGAVAESTKHQFRTDRRIIFIAPCKHHEALNAQLDADCLLYLNFPESRMYEFTSPLKLFEYIASGKPIITTRGGATDEVICRLDEVGFFDNMQNYLRELASRDVDAILNRQTTDFMKEISWDARARKIIQSYMEI